MKLEHNYLNNLKQEVEIASQDLVDAENKVSEIEHLSTLEDYVNSDYTEETLEDLYDSYAHIYELYESGEINLEECHEMIFDEIIDGLINDYKENAKYVNYKYL